MNQIGLHRGGGNIQPPLLEHHDPVYCDLSDTGDISGFGTSDGSMSYKAVVASGISINNVTVMEDGGAGNVGGDGGQH